MSIIDLEQFARQFDLLLENEKEQYRMIEAGRELLGELVSRPEWFQSTLSRLVLDKDFIAAQRQSIDPNDIQIYFSPAKKYTVRAFIWEAGVTYPIHDHGAWGIVGAHINQVLEKKFARIDDGTDPDFARIEMKAEAVLKPGETTYVLPLDDGIHQMQAINNQTAVSIHVYGQPVRKGFIHHFDPHTNSARRVYAPANYKQNLAIKTLGSMPSSWAEDVLKGAIESDNPEFIKNECRLSLQKMSR
jgi:predicted metal-dependent enzyme (double-stranded beta helix superfamily)